MQDQSNRPRQIDPRLKGAVLHPKRLEILDYLIRKRNGVSELELGKALGLQLRQAEYHLWVLHDADLVAYVKDERKRSYVAAAVAGR